MNKFNKNILILFSIILLIIALYVLNDNSNSSKEEPSGAVLVYKDKGVMDYS